MMRSLALLFSLFAQPDYDATLSVEAAYAGVSRPQVEPLEKCCGLCVGGKVVHGDGHVTECACPPSCKCKNPAALLHPPAILRDCEKCSHRD